MDQAAKPVIFAASGLLVVSLITLGVKAGGTDSDPVNGDGPVAAGSDSESEDTTTASPDVEATPDAAPDPSEDTDAAPSTDATTDGSTTDGSTTDGSGSGTDGQADGSGSDADGSTDGSGSDADGSTDGSGSDADGQAGQDLDDMPQTGGGTAVALGGLVAAGGALGLRRRS